MPHTADLGACFWTCYGVFVGSNVLFGDANASANAMFGTLILDWEFQALEIAISF